VGFRPQKLENEHRIPGWSHHDDELSVGRLVKHNPDHKVNLTDLLIGDLFEPSLFDELKAEQARPAT
jgi:hypothetical protein